MQYEIEMKSLLRSEEHSKELLDRLKLHDPKIKLADRQVQRNHYFINGDLSKLAAKLKKYLSSDQAEQIKAIDKKAKAVNVRTRDKNGKVLLIVKGALDDHSAAHSVRRMEFEAEVQNKQDELDQLIIDSGWELEAKWYAERDYYKSGDISAEMIFSPGYGYMVEFEKVVTDENMIETAREELKNLMNELDAPEVDNALIERMFAFYNAHWPEYYGTRKTFTVE